MRSAAIFGSEVVLFVHLCYILYCFLLGLLLFLGVEPYWVQTWWDRLLYTPYCYGNEEPLLQVLSEVLWRSSKREVIDQINLPSQTEVIHWLTFSPVEEHFYKQQFQWCQNSALKVGDFPFNIVEGKGSGTLKTWRERR